MTAMGLAPDGLTIAIGTEAGVIGCLDVPTHQYRTLLRSHTDTINAVAVDSARCCSCNAASSLGGIGLHLHKCHERRCI